jgi:hypothetical protein
VFGHKTALFSAEEFMPAHRIDRLLLLSACLTIVSSALAQARVPLPPDPEQLSVWKVSYPVWFETWDTAAMRCNIDDPTEYQKVRLDYDADMSLDDRSANKQIEELDKRIVVNLKNRELDCNGIRTAFGNTGSDAMFPEKQF